jgi:hypothetical protein
MESDHTDIDTFFKDNSDFLGGILDRESVEIEGEL